ncbi:hypothetical protein LUD75_00565 [Epilithonimonas sp. JDS]|uniref:hypothetical protein n=1 Tax=Epilithonimonas sp. JDS TaxID=2902797 RepID=UPI001E3DA806|nr:hypothetical protein [Epilithonimonas sp. JDS]MCD9853181.1 hypothetical protein [Epilithonimonas sp. JDS]
MKITVTPTARISLNEIISFLKIRWTQREIDLLKSDIKKFRQTINEGIIVHQALGKFPHIRFAIIAKKQVKIFYEIKEDSVLIKLF